MKEKPVSGNMPNSCSTEISDSDDEDYHAENLALRAENIRLKEQLEDVKRTIAHKEFLELRQQPIEAIVLLHLS